MDIQYLKDNKLPDTPGVYFFKRGRDILYIGKATSLRDRVKSYFANDLLRTRSGLIGDMVSLADNLSYEETDSVLEALILEASLIKKHQPKYNTKEKDNKSFNYVIITNEDFPRVLIFRGRDLEDKKIREEFKIKYQFGPFLSGPSLKEALKIVRRIFPFRDKCDVVGESKNTKLCFNAQLGLCPGVCTGGIGKSEYKDTIRNIKLFFDGKKRKLLQTLKKEMDEKAKSLQFEEANKIKRQIFSLNHIKDSSLIGAEYKSESMSDKDVNGFRIEAYDIAHMQGENMTGVMIVIEDGVAKKSDYRMFKIRRKGINDVASLKEVLSRRIKHNEWRKADLIAVDGALPQYNVAKEVMGKEAEVVGVVKNAQHRPERIIGNPEVIKEHQKAILLANSEAHRFTIKYHRKLRGNSFLEN